MSETFHIISDGSCDLPTALAQENNITVVPFYVSFDGEQYLKENVDIAVRDFYQMMVDKKGVYPKSSMPSIQDYEEVFRPFAENDIPVICICITTKFSGSMQSALNAKQLILEKYPQAEITVIDATVNTVLQGEIFPSGLDRGRKRTLKKVTSLLLEYLQNSPFGIDRYSLAVGYGYDREEGIAFRDQALSILREKGYAINEIPTYQIGATIGVHTGPYPLGFGIIERGIPAAP